MGSRICLCCLHILLTGYCGIICLLLCVFQNSSSYRSSSKVILACDLSVRRSIFCGQIIFCGTVWCNDCTTGKTVKIIVCDGKGCKIVKTIIEKRDRFIIGNTGCAI